MWKRIAFFALMTFVVIYVGAWIASRADILAEKKVSFAGKDLVCQIREGHDQILVSIADDVGFVRRVFNHGAYTSIGWLPRDTPAARKRQAKIEVDGDRSRIRFILGAEALVYDVGPTGERFTPARAAE